MNEDDGSKSEADYRPTGMKGFTVVWIGQLVSILGSSMTGFALLIWVWQKTGRAMPFALLAFAYSVPMIAASPLAGALVDRWNKKLAMALSDLMAGASTVIILTLYLTGHLEVWHLYFTGAFAGFFSAFQFPAFSAATTMMVSKKHYSRASAMRSMAASVSHIFAPVLAAILLSFIGIQGILVIDIITFSFAVLILIFVYIPEPPVSKEGLESMGALWKETLYGFKYIYSKKSFFGLLLVYLVMNFTLAFSNVLRAPMILARSGNNELILGGVQSVAAIGGLISSIIMIVWAGPKRKIRGVFIGMFFLGVGTLLLGINEGFILWATAGFLISFFSVIAGALSQAFWQAKVPPDIQGKVFSARSMISGVAMPIALLISGTLADKIFEPAMTEGGSLADLFGWLIGTESGSGMSLLLFLAGIGSVAVTILGYSIHYIRHAEDIVPDHDATGSPKK